MRTAVIVLFAVLVGPAAAAPVPKHLTKDAERDLAALEGKWELTGLTLEGTPLPAGIVAQLKMTLEFQGDVCVTTYGSQDERVTAAVKPDTTAEPRRMLFADEKVTDLGGKPAKKGQDKLGAVIYRIDGDTLTLGSSADRDKDAKAPPADFVSKPGSNTVVMTFKRAKK